MSDELVHWPGSAAIPLGLDTPMPAPGAPDEGAFALTLQAFAAEDEPDPLPLLGYAGQTIIPEHGMAILGGKAGVGKTTLALDLAFSLACARPWPAVDGAMSDPPTPLQCPRALRILLVENEGPPNLFRAKVREKLAAWPQELAEGMLWLHTWRWGAFSLAHSDALARAAEFIEQERIDLVIGDPLRSLGAQGAGSPEDTLAFTRRLQQLGLWERCAFLFLHHFRKEAADDDIDQLSGAWGGHLDALMILRPSASEDQVRLSYPKLRWAHTERAPMILGKVRRLASYEYLGDEGSAAMLEGRLCDILRSGQALTASELAGKEQGVGARRESVMQALEGNPHLFEEVGGKEVGRSPRARCWRLRPGVDDLGGADPLTYLPVTGASSAQVSKYPSTGPDGLLALNRYEVPIDRQVSSPPSGGAQMPGADRPRASTDDLDLGGS